MNSVGNAERYNGSLGQHNAASRVQDLSSGATSENRLPLVPRRRVIAELLEAREVSAALQLSKPMPSSEDRRRRASDAANLMRELNNFDALLRSVDEIDTQLFADFADIVDVAGSSPRSDQSLSELLADHLVRSCCADVAIVETEDVSCRIAAARGSFGPSENLTVQPGTHHFESGRTECQRLEAVSSAVRQAVSIGSANDEQHCRAYALTNGLIAVCRYRRTDESPVSEHLQTLRELLGFSALRLQSERDLDALVERICTTIRGSEQLLTPDPATSTRWRASLTPREHEVLTWVRAGESNAQIAGRLVLSIETVKTHVKHILRKAHASHRAELIEREKGWRN